ncbi:hypothetical protein [Streptomyces sp. NPDC053079]|uniref:hypothetical protein n=1 Tax=Streptomyces sp. NPDC053079 TaxID=3365697 RepID=UPI0037D43E7C
MVRADAVWGRRAEHGRTTPRSPRTRPDGWGARGLRPGWEPDWSATWAGRWDNPFSWTHTSAIEL